MREKDNKGVIDLTRIAKRLWTKRKTFFIVWPIVFVLSVIWILPQPRFYKSSVSLAPEQAGEEAAGGLAGLASNFGINIGGAGADAIYPELYPELFESNEFIADLLKIQVTTQDGSLQTDYYTYLKKHQKSNWLTAPFNKLVRSITETKEDKKQRAANEPLDPFRLNRKDFDLFEKAKNNITATTDKKTSVVTIVVEDQDPLISAVLADSVREHLQHFITKYRTHKARLDVDHYQHLADSAKREYNKAIAVYSAYCDANQDIMLQTQISERDKLESDMQLKYNTFTAMNQQLEMVKAKLQERTPAFTILKPATVPVKPAGPKRMIFVLGMLIAATFVTAFWLAKDEIITQF